MVIVFRYLNIGVLKGLNRSREGSPFLNIFQTGINEEGQTLAFIEAALYEHQMGSHQCEGKPGLGFCGGTSGSGWFLLLENKADRILVIPA